MGTFLRDLDILLKKPVSKSVGNWLQKLLRLVLLFFSFNTGYNFMSVKVDWSNLHSGKKY